MADKRSAAPSIQQYEELKIPSAWTGEDRKFASRLIETLDDVYRRFGRLRLADMGKELRNWIEDVDGNMLEIIQTAQGLVARVTSAEGEISEIQLTTAGVTAAVKNNRLRFSEKGLEIINAAGQVVFSQDNVTGNLTISGIIQALGGIIGGFTIGDSALSAGGTRIVLDALNGLVRLGQLTITDSASFGPVLQAVAGLSFVVGGGLYMALGNNGVTIQRALYAQNGLYVNPGDPVNYPPNVWMNPSTGLLHRTTNTGGGTDPGGGPDPVEPLQAYVSVVPDTPRLGEQLFFNFGASGGVQPYTRYLLRLLPPGGSWLTVYDGPNQGYGPFRISDDRALEVSLTAWDSAGTQAATSMTVYVTA